MNIYNNIVLIHFNKTSLPIQFLYYTMKYFLILKIHVYIIN